MTTWIRPRPDGSLEWCRSGNGLPAEQEWEGLELEGEQGIPADETVTVLLPPDVLWHLWGIPVWVLPPSGRRWLVRLKEALQIAELRWAVAVESAGNGGTDRSERPMMATSQAVSFLLIDAGQSSGSTVRRLPVVAFAVLATAILSYLGAARTSSRLDLLLDREASLRTAIREYRAQQEDVRTFPLQGAEPLLGWSSWTAATVASAVPDPVNIRRIEVQWEPPLDTSHPSLPTALSWRLELTSGARGNLSAVIASLDRTGLPMSRLVLEGAREGTGSAENRRPVLSGRYPLRKEE